MFIGHAELFHGFKLGRQTVGVPAEAAFYFMPALSLVTCYKVFCVTGEQVPVVRQTVCEWRAIVEDEFVIAVRTGFAVIDRCLEGFVFLPIVEYGFFEFRKLR